MDKAKDATEDAQNKTKSSQAKVDESTKKHNDLLEKVKTLKTSVDAITLDTNKAQATADAAKTDAKKKSSIASDLRAKLDAMANAQKDLDKTLSNIQTTKDSLAANEKEQSTTKDLINKYESDFNTHKTRLAKIQKEKADLAAITADSVLPWESDPSYSYNDDIMDSLMPTMTEYRDALRTAKNAKDNLDKAYAARKEAQSKYDEIKAIFDREEANKQAIKETQARARMSAMANPYASTNAISTSSKVKPNQSSTSTNTGTHLDLFSAELATSLAALGMVLASKKRRNI